MMTKRPAGRAWVQLCSLLLRCWIVMVTVCALPALAQSGVVTQPWLAVAPDTRDNRAIVTIEAAVEADPADQWQVKLLRVDAPEWVITGTPSLTEAKLSPAAPLEWVLPFAVGAAPVDAEGELLLAFAITPSRGEAFERSVRVPLWVQEPVELSAEFHPASRDGPARLVLRVAAQETVWNPASLKARIGALTLAPRITVEQQGRVLVAEHRFEPHSPGAGPQQVELQLADQRKGRIRELSVGFDYLLSLEIVDHVLRPLDTVGAAPRQGTLQGGEQVELVLSVQTFEPRPVTQLQLTPETGAPLRLDPATQAQQLTQLAPGKPVELAPVVLEALPVNRPESARVQLQARSEGKAFIAQPSLSLTVEPGETLAVVVDGPVDDTLIEGLPNNADGVPQPGERVRIPLRVINLSEQPQPPYQLQVSSVDERLTILDPSPQPGRALVVGDSEVHWVGARIGADATTGALSFEAQLEIDARPPPLRFPLQLELPVAGPMAALRLPTVVFAFAQEDHRLRASLPPRLLPRNPVYLWEFTDTEQQWRTTQGEFSRRFENEDSGMVRVLLYDADSGDLVAAGGTIVVVFGLGTDPAGRAANRKAVTDMAAMIEGQMMGVLAAMPGATVDEKYQAMVAQNTDARVSEAQRLAMLEQMAGMYGASMDVERVRRGFERLIRDPPTILPGHPRAAAPR